jgi:hypothetical protein
MQPRPAPHVYRMVVSPAALHCHPSSAVRPSLFCPTPNPLGCVTPRLLNRSIQVKLRSGPLPPYGPSRVFSLVAPSFSHRIRRGLRFATPHALSPQECSLGRCFHHITLATVMPLYNPAGPITPPLRGRRTEEVLTKEANDTGGHGAELAMMMASSGGFSDARRRPRTRRGAHFPYRLGTVRDSERRHRPQLQRRVRQRL